MRRETELCGELIDPNGCCEPAEIICDYPCDRIFTALADLVREYATVMDAHEGLTEGAERAICDALDALEAGADAELRYIQEQRGREK